MGNETTGIDFGEALARFDGDEEIYLELIDAFLETHADGLTGFRRAMDNSRAEAPNAAHEAHQLKGAALTLGASELAERCAELEALLRSGAPADLPLVASVVSAFERAVVDLRSFKERGGKPS